jgi:hypothetical protein
MWPDAPIRHAAASGTRLAECVAHAHGHSGLAQPLTWQPAPGFSLNTAGGSVIAMAVNTSDLGHRARLIYVALWRVVVGLSVQYSHTMCPVWPWQLGGWCTHSRAW